jgi:hypothetical protein
MNWPHGPEELNYFLHPNIQFRVETESKSRDSSAGTATDYELDDRMVGVRFPAGTGSFLFYTLSRSALGTTHRPIQ